MRRVLKSPFLIAIVAAAIVASGCGLLSGLLTKDIAGALAIAGGVVVILVAPIAPFMLLKAIAPPRQTLIEEPSVDTPPAWDPTALEVQAIPQPAPAHASGPLDRAFEAYKAILLIAAIDLALGWLFWIFPGASIQPAGISALSALMGTGLLALGQSVRQGSAAALAAATAIVAVEGALGLTSLPPDESPELYVVFLRIATCLVMIGGIRATMAGRRTGEHIIYVTDSTTLPVQTASLAQRFLAAAIDLSILGVAEGCWALAGGLVSTHNWITPVQEWHVVVWGVIAAAIPAVFFIWPYSTSGQTPGKRVLRIKVVSTDGSPLGWRTGILRTMGYILSGMPFGLGFVWAVWQVNRQAGHDKIAGTLVVPALVEREHLQDAIEPTEVRRGRKRWLIGLGVSSLLMAAGILREILRMME